MKKTLLIMTVISFFVAGMGVCAFAKGPDSIRIGVNAPLTGDIPKVGEGTKFAAQMWLEDVTAAGGIEVGGKKYKVELIIEDNESKAESAVKANTKLITEEGVLGIVGPQSSSQAVPAAEVDDRRRAPQVLAHDGEELEGLGDLLELLDAGRCRRIGRRETIRLRPVAVAQRT